MIPLRPSQVVRVLASLLIIGVNELQAETYLFERKIAEGQLNSPFGIAVDGSGILFIADTSNHRIQKYSSSGTTLARWGSLGGGNGQFNLPSGVAVDSSGNVYTIETSNNRIQKFSATGVFLLLWGGGGSNDGQFSNPYGIAVDSAGNVYAADTNNHRIQKFSSTGTFLAKWGTPGSGDGQFNSPVGVAVDSNNHVYVVDLYNHRIQKFDNTGAFVAKWGSHGSGDGQLKFPYGVAVDANRNVYVTDSDNSRVQKFSSTGTFLAKWGTLGSGDGQLSYPFGVGIDTLGNAYVVDRFNNRVQKFNPGYVISGSATDGAALPISDVTLSVNGTAYASTTTLGAFTLTLLAGTAMTLSPSKGGLVFTPTTRTAVSLTADLSAQDFSADAFPVSGWLTNTGGQAVPNVTVSLLGPLTITTASLANGSFSFSAVPAASWTLVPYSSGSVFSPASLTFSVTSAVSSLSLTAVVVTDITAPGTISDFAVTRVSSDGTITFVWTAPGDDATTGTATGYTLKYRRDPITTMAEFNAATTITHSLSPTLAGVRQSLSADQFPNGTLYFAMISADEAGNVSPLSNNVAIALGNKIIVVSIIAGGTIQSRADPKTKLIVPSNLLPDESQVNISIRTKEEIDLPTLARLQPANAGAQGRVVTDTVREFSITRSDDSAVAAFSKPVVVEIPYPDDNDDGIVDGTTLTARELRMMRFNETSKSWQVVADGSLNSVDTASKVVKAEVKHFSLYTIGHAAATALTQILLYPNPVNFQQAVRGTVKFDQLTAGAVLTIFDWKGRMVKKLPAGSSANDGVSGHIEWDGRNEQNEAVSAGIYFYLITDPTGGKQTGKFAVTK